MSEWAAKLLQAGISKKVANLPWTSGRRGHAARVPSAQALEMRDDLRGVADKTGFFPLLMGGPYEPRLALENMDKPEVQETLAKASKLEVAPWFKEREAELRENFDDEHFDGLVTDAWPKKAGSASFYLLDDEPEVSLVLVPAASPWELPAFAEFGGWNECPYPEEHVAVLKYWHQRYGAELVCVGGSTFELHVQKRPATREEALALAWEQYFYCGDIVDQGTDTVTNLAAGLLASNIWFFWWD